MNEDLHLVDWLRKIQLAWDLDLAGLSRIAHVSESVLDSYLKIPAHELASYPSIPAGLESAVALVGLYRRLLTVYPTQEEQNIWLKRQNSIFENHRPIEIMAMSSDHLAYVTYAVESGLRLAPTE
jgi:hypothetical protein